MKCLYIILIFYLLVVNRSKFVAALEYGYSPKDQKQWSKIAKDCGGLHQSPIEIYSVNAIPIALPALEMIWYHNVLSNACKLTNNGHSVSLSLLPNEETNAMTPYIFGAMLSGDYIFNELHFHWGTKNNRGSEHILNNIQYPLEMHLIHRKKKYKKAEATKERDGLVVLAVFFELREKEYKPLNIILDKLKAITKVNCSTTISSLELISLIPRDMELFYIYTGSLTTPPCSEAVTWLLFPDPILISPKQMNEFHTLKNAKNSTLSNNYRLSQPIGDRKIYKRMPDKSGTEYIKNVKFLRNKLYCG